MSVRGVRKGHRDAARGVRRAFMQRGPRRASDSRAATARPVPLGVWGRVGTVHRGGSPGATRSGHQAETRGRRRLRRSDTTIRTVDGFPTAEATALHRTWSGRLRAREGVRGEPGRSEYLRGGPNNAAAWPLHQASRRTLWRGLRRADRGALGHHATLEDDHRRRFEDRAGPPEAASPSMVTRRDLQSMRPITGSSPTSRTRMRRSSWTSRPSACAGGRRAAGPKVREDSLSRPAPASWSSPARMPWIPSRSRGSYLIDRLVPVLEWTTSTWAGRRSGVRRRRQVETPTRAVLTPDGHLTSATRIHSSKGVRTVVVTRSGVAVAADPLEGRLSILEVGQSPAVGRSARLRIEHGWDSPGGTLASRSALHLLPVAHVR